MHQKQLKVVIDTNIWISFLIGKKLGQLKQHIVNQKIKLTFSPQLFLEIKQVSSRKKFAKYFPKDKVTDLIKLLESISDLFDDDEIDAVCRDPKDDYLLALSYKASAAYLVTSDKDLLILKRYFGTEIISVNEFESIMQNL